MDFKKKALVIAITSTTVLSTSGCSTIQKHSTLVAGCAWGALVGTVGGAIAGSGDPAYIAGGAAIGLIAGCGVGYYLENREEELAKAAEETGFKSEFERLQSSEGEGVAFNPTADDDVIASQVSLSTDKPLFKSGSHRVNDAKLSKQLDKFLANYIKTLDKKSKVYVVGHTDSTGSAKYNQKLSQERAFFIAKRMADLGLDKNRIFFEGVGEGQPIAPNTTKEGRSQNRRFEIVDVMANRDTNEKSASLDTVMSVSNAKKQKMTNIMNEKGLTQAKEVKKHKINNENVDTSVVKSSPKTKQKKTKTRDTNPLKLKGDVFDRHESSSSLTSNLGVYHDDSWALFSKANASEDAVIESCAISEPRVESVVRTLGDGGDVGKISDGLPSLIGNYWYGSAEAETGSKSTMVVLGPVYVKRSDFSNGMDATISFTKDYSGSKKSVDYSYKTNVETYRGDDAVLYRVYPNKKNAKLDCADIVFSTRGSKTAKFTELVYTSRGVQHSKTIELKTVL